MPRAQQRRTARRTNIAGVASALADPSRAEMLDILMGGEAHPIGALARRVGVSPATASSHLQRLAAANLVTVDTVGRERRVRLAGAEVAEVLERLSVIAGPDGAQAPAIDQLRFARTCYDHLAGHLGVAIVERLEALGWLYRTSDSLEPASALLAWLASHGHAVAEDARRPLSRACVDWTERVPHLAGRTGAALATLARSAGWVVPVRASRALRITTRGRKALLDELGLALR